MHLILLGGSDKSNKSWIKNVEVALKEYFDTSHVHEYKHWQTDEEMIEIEHEVEQIISHVKEKDEQNYVVFAKSAGALLTIKAISEQKLAPVRCIFAGLPVNQARENNIPIDEWIKGHKVPTLYFQKTNDPTFSFTELQSWLVLSGAENYKTIEFPGKDHYYEDLDSIKKEVANFLFT